MLSLYVLRVSAGWYSLIAGRYLLSIPSRASSSPLVSSSWLMHLVSTSCSRGHSTSSRGICIASILHLVLESSCFAPSTPFSSYSCVLFSSIISYLTPILFIHFIFFCMRKKNRKKKGGEKIIHILGFVLPFQCTDFHIERRSILLTYLFNSTSNEVVVKS